MEAVLFIFWIIFWTVLGGVIGSTKKRTAAGIIWSMLLGPIGVVISCFLKQETRDEKDVVQTIIKSRDDGGPAMKTFDQFKKDLIEKEDAYKHQPTKYLVEKYEEYIASIPKPKPAEAPHNQPTVETSTSTSSTLAELKSMLKSDLITQAEYDTKKAELLARM